LGAKGSVAYTCGNIYWIRKAFSKAIVSDIASENSVKGAGLKTLYFTLLTRK